MIKKTLALLFIAAGLLMLGGCSDDDDTTPAVFGISPEQIEVEGAGGTATITVASSRGWHTYSKPSWCELSPSQAGAGTIEVTLNVAGRDQNNDSRGGLVELISDEGLILSVFIVRGMTDREALMVLYNSTGGDNWLVNTNWGSDLPLDQWAKVRLDDNGRVAVVGLNDNNLTGTLPPEIGKLTKMSDFEVTGNALTGQIPFEIGLLTELQVFGCGSNQLTGAIPSSIGNLWKLYNVYMSFNQFTGPLPVSMGNLPDLKYFSVDHNDITGNIPATAGNLVNLNVFNVSYNRMQGQVPAGVVALPGWSRFVTNGWINPQQTGYGLTY